MESITRNVSAIPSGERRAVESLLGKELNDNQRIIIQIIDIAAPPEPAGAPDAGLPDWCRVYEGLSEQEIADLEKVVLQRAKFSRPE